MAFTDFSEDQYVRTFNSTGDIRLGAFSSASNLELKHIRLSAYLNGVSNLGGSERIRIKIYGESSYASPLYTSDWSSISSITNLGSTNWIGWIRIDFNNEPINKNLTYYAAAEIGNYTRNGDTFYVGLNYDFPFSIYDNSQDFFYDHPVSMSIFGLTERS